MDLRALVATSNGRGLLNDLSTSGRVTTIFEDVGVRLDGGGPSYHLGSFYSDTFETAHLGTNGTPGIPADVRVAYDPQLLRMDEFDLRHDWYSGTEAWQQNTPGRALLSHELTHAWDATHGTFIAGNTGTFNSTPLVELTAVGLRPHPLNSHNENRYRRDAGLPVRTSYLDPSKGAD